MGHRPRGKSQIHRDSIGCDVMVEHPAPDCGHSLWVVESPGGKKVYEMNGELGKDAGIKPLLEHVGVRPLACCPCHKQQAHLAKCAGTNEFPEADIFRAESEIKAVEYHETTVGVLDRYNIFNGGSERFLAIDMPSAIQGFADDIPVQACRDTYVHRINSFKLQHFMGIAEMIWDIEFTSQCLSTRGHGIGNGYDFDLWDAPVSPQMP